MTRTKNSRLPILRTLALWRARAQERRLLAVMTDRELRDIGVSPGEAIAETSKPFWAA